MAGGRHLSPERGGQDQPRSRRVSGPETDWGGMDWLEEQPQPERPRRAARAERPQQQTPRRQTVREDVDWQEDRPRRQSSRQRTYEEEYEQPRRRQQPRQEAYYEQPQPRPKRQRAPEERVYPDQARQRRQPAREEYYDDRRARRPAREAYYDDPEPWRGGGSGGVRQSLPLIILVVILVAGVLFAGGKLLGIMLDYRRDRTAYNDLAEQALSDMAEPDATPDPNAQQGSGSGDGAAAATVDWDYLRGVNSDVVGWLICPGTTINYPVVQTTDNDFYLHRGFTDKQENVAGTLFADSVCNIGSQYNNYIIYGHNMKDGSMFASLQKYVDAGYYEQHPTIYFYTPQGDYRVELIAAHITESTMTNYPYYFDGDWEYQLYLNELTSHSFFATHTAVSTEYQLMTLSTCDYSGGYNDPRFLVHGLMIPIDG